MQLGMGDYYSLSSGGYTKHANVEVIGVDSLEPYPQTPSYSEHDIKPSVIKEEEEMEYDMHGSMEAGEQGSKLYSTTRFKDREEVTSLYTNGEHSETDRSQLVHSLIDNPKSNHKGLKKRLRELQKNNVTSQSQDSCPDDSHLYLELQKEKKLRMDLE
jgi:hypothetical protein